MKVTFDLTLDINGKPCIEFLHYDKAPDLSQKVLQIFIDSAFSKGVEIYPINGSLNSCEDPAQSFRSYRIQLK